jgi:hypothetical protein
MGTYTLWQAMANRKEMPLFITGSRFDFTEALPSGRNFGLKKLFLNPPFVGEG